MRRVSSAVTASLIDESWLRGVSSGAAVLLIGITATRAPIRGAGAVTRGREGRATLLARVIACFCMKRICVSGGGGVCGA